MVTLDNGATDVLSAVLNADRFVEMPEAEQQRLLAQLVEAGKVDIPKEICDSLRAINEERPRLASVGDVEAAHKRFYELRTEASRTLKALGHMEKPDVPADLPSVQEVRKKLDELRHRCPCISATTGKGVEDRPRHGRISKAFVPTGFGRGGGDRTRPPNYKVPWNDGVATVH